MLKQILSLPVASLILAAVLVVPAAAGPAHDFSFRAIEGGDLPLAAYRGKAVLVVNTASFCGYTGQYADLQALWTRYRDRGLVVVGVPSNDFGRQEPGTADEIKQFCEANFDVDFPLADKEVVRGPQAHPFYAWARAELGNGAAPKWNFHKYLVDPEGNLAGWFSTSIRPTAPRVIDAIEALLAPKS